MGWDWFRVGNRTTRNLTEQNSVSLVTLSARWAGGVAADGCAADASPGQPEPQGPARRVVRVRRRRVSRFVRPVHVSFFVWFWIGLGWVWYGFDLFGFWFGMVLIGSSLVWYGFDWSGWVWLRLV